MSLTTLSTALKAALNHASPNQLADIFRAIKLGDVLRSLPVQLNKVAMDGAAGTNPYAIAAAQTVTLPEDAKAGLILFGKACAGSGTKGPLVPQVNSDTAPGTNLYCSVSPCGDLAFYATDAWTSVDVSYLPMKYDVQEVTLPTTSSNTTVTLPPSLGAALFVMEVEGMAGGTPAKKIVVLPGQTPSAGHASMAHDGKTVLVPTADAHTSVRVKYGVAPKVDVNALLEAVSIYF
jgi:hypothetical protein